MMFLCLDCNGLFEEAQQYREMHGLDSPPYETLDGCPYCSGAYVETIQCDVCGNYITGQYVVVDGTQFICDECYVIKDVGDL
jgi:formylmethanofuran dehydrogenase subunit E